MLDVRNRKRSLLAVAALLLQAACGGSIGDAPGGDGSGGGSTGSPSPMGGAGAGGKTNPDPGGKTTMPPPTTTMPASACKGTVDPGSAVWRRLNRFEYDNTLRDLFQEPGSLVGDFPVEEKASGFRFDNDAKAMTVSPLLAEQYTSTAETVAQHAVDNQMFLTQTLLACDPATKGEDACFQSFLNGFARKIYRRPLTDDEIATLKEVYAAGKTTDFKTGVKLALTTMLQSPQFLYRAELGAPAKAGDKYVPVSPWEMASRLSYLLWGTYPDTALRMAAESGKLGTKEEIAAQVQRMLLSTPQMDGSMPPESRLRRVVRHFTDQWFEIEKVDDAEKDAKVFPNFKRGTLGLFMNETRKFLEQTLLYDQADVSSIFNAKFTWVDDQLAKYYGAGVTPPPPKAPGAADATALSKVAVDGKQRGGLLTQGAFLAMLSKPNQSSPVQRGKFVREMLLCQDLPPPPNNVMIVLPALDPNLTTRERFAKHDEVPECKGCHQLMDPIGLGFENYDAVGNYRDKENNKPVDSSGEILGVENGKFNGLIELGQKLATAPEVKDCIVRQWFRFAIGRIEEDADACSLQQIKTKFAAGGYKFKDLITAIVESDAFMYRRVAGGAQ